jgi:hypothetical protein
MAEDEIPIFKKLYELFKLIHSYRLSVAKADRYSLWQKVENSCLDLLELILSASQQTKEAKLSDLQTASIKLSCLRVFIRLAKDTRAIDNKKYLVLQELLDEIGRMLGGWLRSIKPAPFF